MVILGPKDGRVEVRLMKAPFDAANPVYFDEYEKLGKRRPPNRAYECLQYIIPEDTAYGIELTLKRCFVYGGYDGVCLKVYNKVSNGKIGSRTLSKKEDTDVLQEDKHILLDCLSHVQFEGVMRKRATLSFLGLAPGT